MTDNDRTRREVSVLADEVVAGYQALGVPLFEDDHEIFIILNRLEKRLRRKMHKSAA